MNCIFRRRGYPAPWDGNTVATITESGSDITVTYDGVTYDTLNQTFTFVAGSVLRVNNVESQQIDFYIKDQFGSTLFDTTIFLSDAYKDVTIPDNIKELGISLYSRGLRETITWTAVV